MFVLGLKQCILQHVLLGRWRTVAELELPEEQLILSQRACLVTEDVIHLAKVFMDVEVLD
jgi:hypothetical protein